ncbi:hypothetical protein MKW98_028848 [Papaver atlanticum]|uniref:Uncharacterized protein n=1 Tax=Papaver atlanticum TaxID=357466 RepID=A0AAD4S2R6_9MAGN|nr:hypothetical protein MKW98_028848 [Papaver atlanticum]
MPPLKRKQSSGSQNRKKYKKRDELQQSGLVGSLDRYVTRANEPTLAEDVKVSGVNVNYDIAGVGENNNVNFDGNLNEVNGDSDDANVFENVNDMVGDGVNVNEANENTNGVNE